MEPFKTKQDEIKQILESLIPDYKDRIRVQEYISRSILVNYYFLPRGTKKENIIYTPLDNDYYDVGITTTHTSIEIKERSSAYDGRLIIEEGKLQNLFFQRNPYYVCYTLENNKVYTYDLNSINWDEYPIEILKCNKTTYKSTTDKKDKEVRYLPTDIAKTYEVPTIKQFLDVKYEYIKKLTPDKIKKILKR